MNYRLIELSRNSKIISYIDILLGSFLLAVSGLVFCSILVLLVILLTFGTIVRALFESLEAINKI